MRHITFDDFYKMNPSVGKDCSKMALGTYYCLSTYPGGVPWGVERNETTTQPPPSSTTKPPPSTTSGTPGKTPSPVQDGMAKNCNKFYEVVKGDVCADIAKDHKIDVADFYAWNPAVKKDCTGLIAEYYVCVGVEK